MPLPLLLRGGRISRTGGKRPERADILIGEDGRTARLGPDLAQPDAKVITQDLVASGPPVRLVLVGGRLVAGAGGWS